MVALTVALQFEEPSLRYYLLYFKMWFCLGKNRDRLSIIAAILETADSGANKTRIMFGANLSFKLLEKYLDLVVGAGFVRMHDSVYLLTEAGRDFLKQYGDFHDRYAKAQELNEALGSEYEKLVHLLEKQACSSSF